jgi:hypothetical protein
MCQSSATLELLYLYRHRNMLAYMPISNQYQESHFSFGSYTQFYKEGFYPLMHRYTPFGMRITIQYGIDQLAKGLFQN